MTNKAHLRKRPCKICRKWFIPNPKSGPRQKTCSKADCQREWHRRQCKDWNHKNAEYFKGIYLRKKLEAIPVQPAKESATSCYKSSKTPQIEIKLKSDIDHQDFQQIFTYEQTLVLEYLIGQFIRPLQIEIRSILIPDTS